MKAILLAILLALPSLCLAETPPVWGKVAWSTTKAEAAALYPDATYAGGVLKVEGLTIAEAPFVAELVYAGDQLDEIKLRCAAPYIDEAQADRVVKLYAEKYGKPESDTREGVMRSVNWKGGAVITLFHVAPAGAEMGHLLIRYQNPKAKKFDNI